jgi:asparagine synthase (glutamine-hydrolysing)
MCGISGIYGLKEVPTATEVIKKMNETLIHRGPNDGGLFVDNDIALGHRRLSIIDLSEAGHQPMQSPDKRYTLVYNGEVYNYPEVKQKLAAATGIPESVLFKTQSDTEVLLKAYETWGANCLKYLNGMFAFAIWDASKKELFIARDRLGIKPLYYYRKNDLVLFASEVRALLASGLVPRIATQEGVIDFLRYQTVHAPNTMLKDVYMLMPGNSLTIRENVFEITPYWDLQSNTGHGSEGKSYSVVCQDIHDLLHASVERRMISDVPFGAFLSGGIDSSAIVALMSEVSNRQVKTFSVVFDDSALSEARYAQMIADKFHTEHHELKLTPLDFLQELHAGLDAFDHPSADALNTYMVSKLTKEAGITMALSGLGGDELFAGYDIFNRSQKLNNFRWLWNVPSALRNFAGNMLVQLKDDMSSHKIKQLLDLENGDFSATYPISRQFLNDDFIMRLVHAKVKPENAVCRQLKAMGLRSNDKPNFLSTVSIAEITSYMQNVILRDTDQMSMAHALEVRVPFLDYSLVEYVLGIQDVYKFRSYTKSLLVESLGNLLPPEIVHRPKMGFLFPWDTWLRNDLRAFCETKIQHLGEMEFFDKKLLLDYWNNFLKGDRKINWARIWIFVVLSTWLTKNQVRIE